MDSIDATLTLLLVFSVALSNAQLNFEGNPLTEYTEYTAEESQPLETAANDVQVISKSARDDAGQKIYPVYSVEADKTPNSTVFVQRSIDLTPQLLNAQNENSKNLENRQQIIVPYRLNQQQHFFPQQQQQQQQQQQFYPQPNNALNHFLNSQTPEESRLALEYYLGSQQNPGNAQPEPSQIQQFNSIDQPQQYPSYQIPSQNAPQILQVPQNLQQQAQPNFPFQSSLQNPGLVPGPFQARPGSFGFGPGLTRFSRHQARPGFGRMSGKPIMLPQQRLGPQMVYKNPPPSPSYPAPPKYKAPIEVIYTKPPVRNRPPRNPPVSPYEDPGSWFSEADRPVPPGPSKDVLWSQLYAQSYDPHYYNYIAKTGKIKPHLYGKFQDPPEEDGIWNDMYQGFKKHGLKNIMNPTFLLGMTIPALTLMLTALVQNRSFARADYGPAALDQEKLEEYLTRLQRGLQAYNDANRGKRRR